MRREVQPFQPDPTPTRASRPATNTQSPQPSPAPAQPFTQIPYDYRPGQLPNVMNYIPQTPMALTLRPVVTPGNNSDLFRQRAALAKAQKLPKPQIHPQHLLKDTLPPGQMSGPNIYKRCLYGLRSGVPEQQDFALHHLVKVSDERGDKYMLEGFPMLAESLIEKALEITELLYGAKWELSYTEQSSNPNVLDGSFGTPHILDRIERLKAKAPPKGIESAELQHKLQKVTEAVVVIRNMVWLDDNATFVSTFPYFRDFLVIALNLPKTADISEYEQCALKICEEVTPYFTMTARDPLFQSLLRFIESDDRGSLLSALTAIDYISASFPFAHKLTGLSMRLVQQLCFLTTLPDEIIQIKALKLLYQYTSHPENLVEVLNSSPGLLEQCVPRLIHFLMADARQQETRVPKPAPVKVEQNTVIPTIPAELLLQLIQISEPDRSRYWLRSCFEENAACDITQIAIWQAYQAQFSQHTPLAASEFIKNVSSTFTTAQAQVISGPQPRFIIKGITPRRIPVDKNGNQLQKCLWEIPSIDSTQPGTRQCGTFHMKRQSLWTHILNSHLQLSRDENGKFQFTQAPAEGYKCCWPNCRKAPAATSRDIGTHVKVHLPDDEPLDAEGLDKTTSTKPKNEEGAQDAEYSTFTYYESPIEAGLPAGIAGPSLLILQNIARNLNKLAIQEKAAAAVPGGGLSTGEKSFVGMSERIFSSAMKEQLAWIVAYNRTLVGHISRLLSIIEKGETSYRALREKGETREDNRMIF